MRPIQRVIATGFATAAIASASLPAMSWTVWPDADFEWSTNVGRTANARDLGNDTRMSRARLDARDEGGVDSPLEPTLPYTGSNRR